MAPARLGVRGRSMRRYEPAVASRRSPQSAVSKARARRPGLIEAWATGKHPEAIVQYRTIPTTRRSTMDFRPLWLDGNRKAGIWSRSSFSIMPFARGQQMIVDLDSWEAGYGDG